MRKLRLVCIWREEEISESPDATSDGQQTEPELDKRPTARRVPELVCIHNKDRGECPICSRDWTQPQTGQLPYRPKAA
jgi:hypothetical protein